MLVQGLEPKEIDRLDSFEGEEYERRIVAVQGTVDDKPYQCETYIFLDKEALEESEWDFATFEREKIHRWTGETGEAEYHMLSAQEDGTNGRSSFS